MFLWGDPLNLVFSISKTSRFFVVLALLAFACGSGAVAKTLHPEGAPTFNRDVAPILFGECVVCHHPGGIGPFSLATYPDAKKRAQLIARVTGTRFMPPWLPAPGHGDFVGERTLTAAQIATIARWFEAGAPEGAAGDLKAKAEWNDDWQLGKPDLIVTLPEAFTLFADGRDVYRNFVIPNPVSKDRFLRALEFRPGPTKAIHHAFVLVDDTGAARRRAAIDQLPGFAGMDVGDGATSPNALFLSWQPGRRPSEAPDGMAALLHKNTDIVLQLHMRPTGKPETIRPTVALYFTDQPPRRFSFRILLRSVQIDIPAGVRDYAIESSYEVPVDTDVLALLPHLHYLGREVHGWAELPDGTTKELILIKNWDFNWQADYRFAAPVFLPKGTTLRMRYTYDNSSANPNNPSQPPQRVTYGLQTTDEMGELWLQVEPRNPADFEVLARDFYFNSALPDSIARSSMLLRAEPKNAEVRTELANALAASGRSGEAMLQLGRAVEDDPKYARAYAIRGQILIQQNNMTGARAAVTRAVELDPSDQKSQNNLGWLLLGASDVPAAIEHLERAVQLDPSDALAIQNLERARARVREAAR